MAERATQQPKYDIQKPPEGYTSVIDWTFGADPYTKQLSQRLGYQAGSDDIELAQSLTRREPAAIARITEIWGRSAKMKSPHPEAVLEMSYDVLEIGGFGCQPITVLKGASGQVDFSTPITLPSADNFAASHNGVTHTNIVDEGREVMLGDPFSFTGAYTKKQAARKVAANLFILNKLANMKPAPFVVPIPIAIGHYPSVVDYKGEPAYYIVFKVPYEGKRTGVRAVAGNDIEGIKQYGEDLINGLPAIVSTLALISNRWGLTHNQPHPANFYIPTPSEGSKPYLADFSTLYPLKPKKQESARARELARGMQAVWDTITSHFKASSESNLAQHIFKGSPQ